MIDPIMAVFLSFAVAVIAILALGFAAFKYKKIAKAEAGTPKMKEIAAMIHNGSMTFLNKEYKVMVIFVVLVAAILVWLIDALTAVTFVAGAILSSVAGNIGMRVATKANVRTTYAVDKSLSKGLKIAFSSGSVMGMSVVGLGLLGVTVLYLLLGKENLSIIFGFGFGASFVALFARVGGGIFTKAADVGADLVGKVEKGIPEDDPRNPAVIADNVGDNVGDVAGMGADLFESYVDSIIAAMILGSAIGLGLGGTDDSFVILPLILAAVGILCSMVGTVFVKTNKKSQLHSALNKGIFIAAGLMIVASFFVINGIVNATMAMNVFYSTLTGIVAGIIIGKTTEYYTSADKGPAKAIAMASKTGSATNIIKGLSTGMISTIIPVLAVCATIMVAFLLGGSEFGLYYIAIAAVGMLSTLGITLATDTYGPVADNAAGIAEMAGLDKSVRTKAEALDAVGNTTAAIGKGFAIGSAALTALALFASYIQVAGLTEINITSPPVVVGLFIGGLLPFVFSALSMNAVGKSAQAIVEEVRMQFKKIKGLMEGKAKADYKKCIAISTNAALKEMIAPSLIAVATPILVGVVLGAEAVGGLLVGTTVTGFLMAVFMSNAGGAWDNAKKYIEEGHLGGKGSDPHKAAVVGDTVGDPFKDTSGPSLNILIKLISIVALVFVPIFL